MLAVFEVTLVFNEAISVVLAVILDVFDVTLVSRPTIAFVFEVMLAVFDAMLLVFVVMLEVFAVTLVFNDAISVVFAVILFVLDVTLVSRPAIAAVLLVIFVVLDVILVLKSFSAFVALLISVVILAVLEAINVGNVVIVDEKTPPTLFTVGKSAVPPKSFVNFNIPITVAVALGAPDPPTNAETNSVVAICVVLVPGAAVGAVGVPVKDGDAIVARNNISAVFEIILVSNPSSEFFALVISAVILEVLDAISLVFVVILEVLEATLEFNAITPVK